MKIEELMNASVRTIKLQDTVQHAASIMEQEDVGALPVTNDERLLGMLTDRDIVLRVVAARKDPNETKVQDVMTDHLLYCYSDDDSADVADNMAEQGVLRLPVVDRDKRLVGIVSAGDLHKSGETRANDDELGPGVAKLGENEGTFADGGGVPGRRSGDDS